MLQVQLNVDSIERAVIGPNAWTVSISLFRAKKGCGTAVDHKKGIKGLNLRFHPIAFLGGPLVGSFQLSRALRGPAPCIAMLVRDNSG